MEVNSLRCPVLQGQKLKSQFLSFSPFFIPKISNQINYSLERLNKRYEKLLEIGKDT